MFTAVFGMASAYDNSKYYHWDGWTNPPFEFGKKNSTYVMLNSVADCKHYPEKVYPGWTYVKPTDKHTHTTFMLHGVGGSSNFFKPDFVKRNQYGDKGHGYDKNTRVVLPQAGLHKLSALKKNIKIPSWLNFMAWKKALINKGWN
jgi:hypothetical protein